MGMQPWISVAPVHVVVGVREESYHERYRKPDKLRDGEEIAWPAPYWYVDAGSLFMLLQLAALDEGLGTGVYGVPGERRAEPSRSCSAIPEDVHFVCVVTIGKQPPEIDESPLVSRLTQARRPLDELVLWERWPGLTAGTTATLPPRCAFRQIAVALSSRSSCSRSPHRPAASEQFGDLDVSFLSLQVNARGEALVTYRTTAGDDPPRLRLGRDQRQRARSRTCRRCASSTTTRAGSRSIRPADVAHVRGPLPALRRAQARRGSSPPARRRTAPTGRCSAGSGCCPCAASNPSRPGRPPTSCTSPTGRDRCPCSRCRRTGRTAASGRGSSAGSPISAIPSTASGRRRHGSATRTRGSSTSTRYDSAFGDGLEARRRQGRAQPQRRLLLQLRAPADAARLPRPRAAAAGERRAPPRHGDGARASHRCVQWEGAAIGTLRPAAGRGLQRALRPDRRAGRQGLRRRALTVL